MGICPFSLGLFLYEGYVPRKLFDSSQKSKAKINITLGLRGIQIPNCFGKNASTPARKMNPK